MTRSLSASLLKLKNDKIGSNLNFDGLIRGVKKSTVNYSEDFFWFFLICQIRKNEMMKNQKKIYNSSVKICGMVL